MLKLVVALVTVTGAVVVVQMIAGCDPPRDQAEMIKTFEADPLSVTAPDDGELVEKWSHTYWCDSGMRHGGSPTSPGFAEVKRTWQTPATYSVSQLRQLFDAPAAQGGWAYEASSTGPGDYAQVEYSRQIGCRGVRADVSSARQLIPRGDDLSSSPGIELLLGAAPKCDTDIVGR